MYRKNIEEIELTTAPGSIVLTNLNLPYLHLFFRDHSRKFIPISRNTEYASKIISLKKNPSLREIDIGSPFAHRHPQAVLNGIEPIEYIFLEDPTRLEDAVRDQRVYLDFYATDSKIAEEYTNTISKYYNLEIVGERIYKLRLLAQN